MAGWDKEYEGEARLTDGFTARYLPQEPQLNPEKDVQGNVEEAVAPTRRDPRSLQRHQRALAEPLSPTKWKSSSPSRPACRTRSTS